MTALNKNPLTPKPHWWHALFRKMGGTSWGATLSSQIMHRADKPIYQWSNGRITLTAILVGLPVIKLTTTGAKSGQPRTIPLTCIPDDDNLILIASNWGGDKHPGWYHNLTAHPDVIVTLNNVPQPYVAQEVFGDEREACWQTAVSIYPGYNTYAERVNKRNIPVIRLSPQT